MRAPTEPIRVDDRERVRSFLETDREANAVVWNRVYEHPGYRELWIDDPSPKALLAMDRATSTDGTTGFVLHAIDVSAARELMPLLPAGDVHFHLTEEWQLGAVEERASEIHARPAWLFRLDPKRFVDLQTHEVHPVPEDRAPIIAALRAPGRPPGHGARITAEVGGRAWPAEAYVRSRIRRYPTAGVTVDGELVAWALTHFETDRVMMMGFLHVLEAHRRRGYAKSAGSALAKEAIRRGKTPILHVYADNVASIELTEAMGFRRVKKQVWGDAVLR